MKSARFTLDQLPPDARKQAVSQLVTVGSIVPACSCYPATCEGCRGGALPAPTKPVIFPDVPHYCKEHFKGNERVLQREAEGYLKSIGCLVWHMPGIVAAKSFAGWPDLIVLAPCGKLLLIELKTATGKVSDRQRDTFALMAELGHTVHVCRCIGDVRDVLIATYGDAQ